MKQALCISIIGILLLAPMPADAALTRIGAFIYDDIYDTTWLRDFNFVVDEVNVDFYNANEGKGLRPDGAMDLGTAHLFVKHLNTIEYGRISNWRLPVSTFDYPGFETSTIGNDPDVYETVDYGKLRWGTENRVTPAAPDAFTNLSANTRYWVDNQDDPGLPLYFNWGTAPYANPVLGKSTADPPESLKSFVTAVHDGAPVPIPGALTLLLSGGIALIGLRRRFMS